MPYKVLIVDDQKMIRSVFEAAVAESDLFELADSLSRAAEAVEFMQESDADLVIMDVVMPGKLNGLAAAKQIKEISPDTKILIVTSMPEVSYIQRAREAKVDSFWYKEIQDQPILEIMERTMAGESVYPDSSPPVVLGNIVSTALTSRELEVLRELVGGASNKEIGEKLYISESTVKVYIKNMLQKTGFRSRLELAIKARSGGLVIQE